MESGPTELAPRDNSHLTAIPNNGVLLHVGVHKTGTTAIQAALADAREDLAAHNVRYPGKLQAQHRAALAVLGRPWGWNARGGGVLDREHFDRLARRTAKSPGRTVISSEFFCEAPLDTATEVVRDLASTKGSPAKPVHVVVTLRNLGNLLPSSWQQYLKYGLTTPYEKWLSDVFATPGKSTMTPTFWKRHAHGDVITRWSSAVGPENLTVIVLETLPRDAQFRLFAQLLGVPESVLTVRMELTSNRSMTAAEAELLVRLNKSVKKSMQWDDYVRLVRRGVALGMVEGRTPAPSEPRLLTPDWALDAAAVEGNAAADAIAASGVRVVGDLDSLRVRIPSAAAGNAPVAVESDIPIDAAVAALVSIIGTSKENPTPRQLAGKLVRETKTHGVRSLLRKNSE